MSTRLSRWQSILLGLAVVLLTAAGVAGAAALAAKERLWSESYDVTLILADASDVPLGTPVRVRGVDAGHVASLDDSGESVKAVLRLDPKYRGRICNDAVVRLQPVGLLGAKAVAISPGTVTTGPLENNTLTATPAVDLAAVAEKLSTVADEAGLLLKEARDGKGTLAKLVKDDSLFRELTALAADARTATGTVEREAAKVNALVTDGRDALRSVRQSTDAVQRLPIVRGYVENADVLLVRPDLRREAYHYNPPDLFEAGTAILHETGRQHVANLADLFKGRFHGAKAEFVVVALADPNDVSLTSGAALELTRKQAAAIADALKATGAHKTGFFSKNHPVTPLGLGTGPSPVAETYPLPARLTVYAFTPP